MDEGITDIELTIESETFHSGTSKGQRLVPAVVEDDEEAERWLDLAQHVIRKYCTGDGIKHRLDDEGDQLTLGDLLERNGLTIADLERERHLSEFNVTDLSVGDIVAVRELDGGEPNDIRHGVVRGIQERSAWLPAGAKIAWDSLTWSSLENKDGKLRIGRGNMLSEVYDVNVVDPSEANDDLLALRADILESANLDAAADECEVTVETTWESGTENEHVDLHANVTVDGPMLDSPVSVHCRNIFEAGWVASIDGAVDDETEALVICAARKNSPIPTQIRL